MKNSNNKPKILPGFKLSLGYSMLYLSLIVLIPLSAVFIKASSSGWSAFWLAISNERVLAAFRISFLSSLLAAAFNTFFGLIVAWVLVRYKFYGKKLLDAMIDLPFALPTAVSGIALTAVYAKDGYIGKYLALLGINVAFTPLGIFVAMVFIGLPFVVRTVQPLLEDLEKEIEEAAVCLGAKRYQTILYLILPPLLPAILTGFALAFARAVGEYGSVIFIAGNVPMRSEIAPLLIVSKLEQYDYVGATSIALAMLLISFALLFLINLLQSWSYRRQIL